MIATGGLQTAASVVERNELGGVDISFLSETCYVLLGTVFLLSTVAMAVWVFKDAEERGSNPLPWTVLILFTNIFGLLIYLFSRE